MRHKLLVVISLILLCASAASARTQTLTIVNNAHIGWQWIHHAERAFEIEARQLARYWHSPQIRFGTRGWPVVLTPINPGPFLGIHNYGSINYQGAACTWANVLDHTCPTMPFAYAWERRGAFDTVTLSHEIMEMLVDPHIDRHIHGRLVEVCDPSNTYYEIDNVWVQGFVTPRWFDRQA